MKIVNVDVSKLETHAEKCKIQQAFEALGWSTEVGMRNTHSLIPEIVVDYYRFTWWENSEPLYPPIPRNCFMSDYAG